MDVLVESLQKILIFFALLGGVVVIHELGHYLTAIRCGVHIQEFGLGLPPRMKVLTVWHGTEMTLNWIPFGGFVRPSGEFDPSLPNGLAASSPWKRLAIFSAGGAANLLFAILIFALAFSLGWPEGSRILEVNKGSPAEAAGLMPGDVVVQANSRPIGDSLTLKDLVYDNLGRPIELQVVRGEVSFSTILTPRTRWPEGQGAAGFSASHHFVRHPLSEALPRAGAQVIFQLKETAALPLRVLQGEINPDDVRFISLIGLKQVSDRVVDNTIVWGEWFPILRLLGVVSVALGFTNLLPFPALDGGRMAFVVVEMILRKRVDARLEKGFHVAGMLALFTLMIALMIRDVVDPLF